MTPATFDEFRRVLLGLGFADQSVPGSRARFEHAGSGTDMLLRPYRDGEAIDMIVQLGYRRILDEKGVVSREHFDELLRQHPLAG